MSAITNSKFVNQLHWISALSLIILTSLINCQPISDSFYSPRSEEIYNYNPHHGQYSPSGESYPDSYRDLQYQYQPHPPYPYAQAASYLEPDVQAFQNGQFHPPQTGFGYGGHQFQPEMSSMLFENPLKKAMEQGKEKAEESLQQMQARMSEAGKKMKESAGEKADEAGKKMQGMTEEEDGKLPKGEGTDEGALPSPPGLPDSRSLKKDEEKKDGEKKDEKSDEKSEESTSDNPLKKMAEAGSEMMKKLPEAMGKPNPIKRLIGRYTGIKDETTEAHDHDHYHYYQDEDAEFPRAERAEWGVPDVYDVRMQPRSDYFDYYDGHY